jgi:hypothetical protein
METTTVLPVMLNKLLVPPANNSTLPILLKFVNSKSNVPMDLITVLLVMMIKSTVPLVPLNISKKLKTTKLHVQLVWPIVMLVMLLLPVLLVPPTLHSMITNVTKTHVLKIRTTVPNVIPKIRTVKLVLLPITKKMMELVLPVQLTVPHAQVTLSVLHVSITLLLLVINVNLSNVPMDRIIVLLAQLIDKHVPHVLINSIREVMENVLLVKLNVLLVIVPPLV